MSDAPDATPSEAAVRQVVLVAALGYFVDIYDLILFTIVRVPSLRSLGLTPGSPQMLETGLLLLNLQMVGMLLGGLFWGVLGDRRGRLSVLYGSIILYSLANALNGLVQSVPQYAALRFIAGVGLAGELGAGITLVSELMDKHRRGVGTTVVASVGVLGAVLAALVGDLLPWRVSYFVGGGLGFAMLLLRWRVSESPLFKRAHSSGVRRGDLLALLRKGSRLVRYLAVIAVGLPIWFSVSVLVGLAPEFGRTLGTNPAPTAGRAVLFYYGGLALGDVFSGLVSQALRSRKRALGLFLAGSVLALGAYFGLAGRSLVAFYACCGALGICNGYWAVFVTVASEQFGTNVRATVTTTVPNFVRGAVLPITMSFQALRGPLGLQSAALTVGAVTLALAGLSVTALHESFGRDLDFVEED